MPTKLIFLRHGQSEGNKLGRFNGSCNFPLSETGEKQAQLSAEYLDNYKIDCIYSSDLDRAYKTAEYTAKRQNLEIIKCEKLREINAGDFEGKLYNDLLKMFPVEFATWKNDMANCVCPNGESVRDLLARVKSSVEEIASKHKGQTVLISTHATPIRVMTTVWHKKDIEDIRDFDWVKNASVTVVNYDDIENPVIELYDEHEHLKDLLTKLPSSV